MLLYLWFNLEEKILQWRPACEMNTDNDKDLKNYKLITRFIEFIFFYNGSCRLYCIIFFFIYLLIIYFLNIFLAWFLHYSCIVVIKNIYKVVKFVIKLFLIFYREFHLCPFSNYKMTNITSNILSFLNLIYL